MKDSVSFLVDCALLPLGCLGAPEEADFDSGTSFFSTLLLLWITPKDFFAATGALDWLDVLP